MIDWINDPMLQNMDPLKIELIKTAASQGVDGKSSKSLPPILMSLIMSANRKGIRFSSEEMTLILSLLKQGKSEQEQKQIDKTVEMVSSMMTKYQK